MEKELVLDIFVLEYVQENMVNMFKKLIIEKAKLVKLNLLSI